MNAYKKKSVGPKGQELARKRQAKVDAGWSKDRLGHLTIKPLKKQDRDAIGEAFEDYTFGNSGEVT